MTGGRLVNEDELSGPGIDYAIMIDIPGSNWGGNAGDFIASRPWCSAILHIIACGVPGRGVYFLGGIPLSWVS